MSNYFPCRMKMYNIDFASSEHACQWRFLQYIDKSDLTEEVRKAPTAAEAKSIASRVPSHLHKDWHSQDLLDFDLSNIALNIYIIRNII